MAKQPISTLDPWGDLKKYTAARIALGRAGGSLPTSEWLNFKLAHAKARDAVHCEFNSEKLLADLKILGYEMRVVNSQVNNRAIFLQRPDLGRRLNKESVAIIEAEKAQTDLVFIISDGLSATAVHANAANLLKRLLPKFNPMFWTIAPLIIAHFGRVALEDEIGALIGAKTAVMLIGERPGLGSPDSLGAYIVYNPRRGNTDADRNCVSNIRPAGLDYSQAADTLFYLLDQAKRRKLTGVKLKDDRKTLEGLKEG